MEKKGAAKKLVQDNSYSDLFLSPKYILKGEAKTPLFN